MTEAATNNSVETPSVPSGCESNSPDMDSASSPDAIVCLTPECGLVAFKRGLCSRCDSERRKFQKSHPDVTDAELVRLNLLAPKAPPPGRSPNTKERPPCWLPVAVVRLSKRKGTARKTRSKTAGT